MVVQILKNVAKYFLNELFVLPSYPQGLTIIGIGSTTYADTWIGRTLGRSPNIDYYLAPRIFHIARHTNIKGEIRPILTHIAEGTATEAKEYSPHPRIFEPCWLDG